eukprot:24824-Amphidinium_carterae.1
MWVASYAFALVLLCAVGSLSITTLPGSVFQAMQNTSYSHVARYHVYICLWLIRNWTLQSYLSYFLSEFTLSSFDWNDTRSLIGKRLLLSQMVTSIHPTCMVLLPQCLTSMSTHKMLQVVVDEDAADKSAGCTSVSSGQGRA